MALGTDIPKRNECGAEKNLQAVLSGQAFRFPRERRPMQCIGEMPVKENVFGELKNSRPFRMRNVTEVGLDSCFMRGRVTVGGERREPARSCELQSARPPSARYGGHGSDERDNAAERQMCQLLGTPVR